MSEFYTPTSSFLVMVANDEIPLVGGDLAEQNLRLLIDLTDDADVSNRDWATMLLACRREIDTPYVRQALLKAAGDLDSGVRGEALFGLAERDPLQAMPLIERELDRDDCHYAAFQAAHAIASQVARASFLNGLRRWSGRAGGNNDLIDEAIAACEVRLAAVR